MTSRARWFRRRPGPAAIVLSGLLALLGCGESPAKFGAHVDDPTLDEALADGTGTLFVVSAREGADAFLIEVDLEAGTALPVVALPSDALVRDIAVAEDAVYLSLARGDAPARLMRWRRGDASEVLTELARRDDGGAFGALSLGPRGEVLYAGVDGAESPSPLRIFAVPLDGGAGETVALGGTEFAFSPDGTRVVYSFVDELTGEDGLVVADADFGSPVTLLAPEEVLGVAQPTFAEDGRSIRFTAPRLQVAIAERRRSVGSPKHLAHGEERDVWEVPVDPEEGEGPELVLAVFERFSGLVTLPAAPAEIAFVTGTGLYHGRLEGERFALTRVLAGDTLGALALAP